MREVAATSIETYRIRESVLNFNSSNTKLEETEFFQLRANSSYEATFSNLIKLYLKQLLY